MAALKLAKFDERCHTVFMSDKSPKRPRDLNQWAKHIADIVSGEVADVDDAAKDKDPAAVALGRKGGLKGGKARKAALSSERRSEIAKAAAKARWTK